MTSAGVVLAETVCVKNSHLSPLGHTRHTRHAGHISTNPQVNALPIDLSGALGAHGMQGSMRWLPLTNDCVGTL